MDNVLRMGSGTCKAIALTTSSSTPRGKSSIAYTPDEPQGLPNNKAFHMFKMLAREQGLKEVFTMGKIFVVSAVEACYERKPWDPRM